MKFVPRQKYCGYSLGCAVKGDGQRGQIGSETWEPAQLTSFRRSLHRAVLPNLISTSIRPDIEGETRCSGLGKAIHVGDRGKTGFTTFISSISQGRGHRRWNLQRDIPWDHVGHSADPPSFMVVKLHGVELYLPITRPDSAFDPRQSRPRWFQANWATRIQALVGLEMWLLNSGSRTGRSIPAFSRTGPGA